MLTPFLGELTSASIVKAVVAAAGPPGTAFVWGDSSLLRALTQRGFRVLYATLAARPRVRSECFTIRAAAEALPLRSASIDVMVLYGFGFELRGAAEDALAAADRLRAWIRPLQPNGRLVLVDRIDGGLLGARPAPTREDLCSTLLAANMCFVGQMTPRGGTVVTCASVSAQMTVEPAPEKARRACS